MSVRKEKAKFKVHEVMQERKTVKSRLEEVKIVVNELTLTGTRNPILSRE